MGVAMQQFATVHATLLCCMMQHIVAVLEMLWGLGKLQLGEKLKPFLRMKRFNSRMNYVLQI